MVCQEEHGDREPMKPLSWVELSFSWALATKNDHAIKMIQREDFGQGQGIYIIHIPAFIAHSMRSLLLIYSPFIASISHPQNSLEIDKCAALKPLNGRSR